MSTPISPFKVRYMDGTTITNSSIVLELDLNMDFGISPTKVSPTAPFVSEMSLHMTIKKVEKGGTTIGDILPYIKDKMFKTGNVPQLEYFNLLDGSLASATSKISHINFTGIPIDLSTSAEGLNLSVKLLFLVTTKDEGAGFSVPAILYPKFTWPNAKVLIADASKSGGFAEIIWEDAEVNSELKAGDKLHVQQDCIESGSGQNAAAQIISGITQIGATLEKKLTNNINTSLQPTKGKITPDLALWLVIQKSTEDLSFAKFEAYMNDLFCGKGETTLNTNGDMKDQLIKLRKSRSLPFMGVDAFQSIKIATEAFVMVNCMTDGSIDTKTLTDLNKIVVLEDSKPIDKVLVDSWWEEYKKDKNGNSTDMIPYLDVIRNKFPDKSLKTSSFADALDVYISSGKTSISSNCYGIIQEKLLSPCFLELIWSYWHEESMMVQGLNAIGRRFQNIKGPGEADPLAQLNIDPLRPLSNLLWGYLQDEQHRLTVRRRAYEYDHHYGITLQGTAVQNMRFADSRSKFIEAFHTLLNMTSKFYKQADDMTVQPDAFPILNALKEVHLVLSEGAHNQYGDLPSVARAEMLMQQWLLARPEFREFLPTRIMVAYPEDWMPRVAAINNLMGWTKTNVMHFRDLGRFGEQLLLSIRFGNWADITDRASAGNWANFWRSEIQSYMHAYRAVTGVDLTADITTGGRIDAVQPSIHLQRRLLEQRGKVA